MKVLILGGTNYFGKIIVRQLLSRGDEVWLFSRGQKRPEFLKEVHHVEGDRTDYEAFHHTFKSHFFDAVIDNIAYKKEDVECAVRTFRGSIGKYLFTSTVSVYGGLGHAKQCPTAKTGPMLPHLLSMIDMDLCCPMKEEDLDLSDVEESYDPDLEVYAQGKRQCEKYLLEQPDFNHVSIRVPPVLGPEDPTRRIWYYIQRVFDGKEIILPDGGQNIFRNMFSVDVANALIAAIDSEQTQPGAYNICQGEIMTLKRLIKDIAEAAGKEPNLVSIPRVVLETRTDLPYESWRFDPFSRPAKYIMSLEKARRDFNMQWTPQREWVKTTVEWYQTEYNGQDSVHYEQREKEVKIARQYRKAFQMFIESLSETFST